MTDHKSPKPVCSQSIDSTVDVDTLLALLWELSGIVLDADTACSHFDAGCAAVQAGDVNYEDASLF